ncbi:MAG TPA: acetate/propionate family kinase [Candidatus Binataceae bacterium]|jgi:acetate kinase|nr:acetate/propionate family kinase [Candidatus Binataceae bacterium]
MKVLVFNCGSSTLKFELLELELEGALINRLARGVFEKIGPQAHARMSGTDGRKFDAAVPVANHAEAATRSLDWLRSGGDSMQLDAIAHRIVHGGDSVSEPTLVDDSVIEALDEASRFAPLHNPPAIATLRAVRAQFSGVPSIVATDTAFHRTLPPVARTYAIPRTLAARHRISRFGFHGIGHSWMLDRYSEITGRPTSSLNLITLQLGAGCSAAALRAGRSIDTSMGLTPLEGLMMATRSGDLDPAIFSYLASSDRMPPDEVERLLNHDSGLLGVSGLSGDMRELEAAAAINSDAALAIEIFCYRIRKYIGAYMAVLGRVDAIIFSAGIGEHSANVRGRVCSGLEPWGIEIDEVRNRAADGREACFSADASRTALWVVPLDEELQIARAAARLAGARGA